MRNVKMAIVYMLGHMFNQNMYVYMFDVLFLLAVLSNSYQMQGEAVLHYLVPNSALTTGCIPATAN